MTKCLCIRPMPSPFRARWMRFAKCRKSGASLGLADSLQPAIDYLENGMPVPERVAWDWSGQTRVFCRVHARTHFLEKRRRPSGAICSACRGRPMCSSASPKHGRDGFYTGEVAEDMLATLNALGGEHTEADFANTAATIAEPISGTYKGRELLEHGTNGPGGYGDPVVEYPVAVQSRRDGSVRGSSARISRPRRPSWPMTRAIASWPIPIT